LGFGQSPEATAGKVLASRVRGMGGQVQQDAWLFEGRAVGPVDLWAKGVEEGC
jgi:hypothetical protein